MNLGPNPASQQTAASIVAPRPDSLSRPPLLNWVLGFGAEAQMSKLCWSCGHVIRDQTDNLPYKGHVLRDFDTEAVYDAVERECEALIAAVVAGDRESWLRRHFLQCYPRD